MAHFAELDQNNVVTRVVSINTLVCLNSLGQEVEEIGKTFCQNLFNTPNWVQTSYNNKIRKHFARAGYTYNSGLDAFIPPQPYASWTLDSNTCDWVSPVPYPTDGKDYKWNEATLSWNEV